MKSFWIGVASTLVAGILLFLVQDRYAHWQKQNQQSVDIRIDDDALMLDRDVLRNLINSSSNNIRFAIITATNSGSDTLEEPTLRFASGIGSSVNLHASGTVPKNFEPYDSVKITREQKGFLAQLPILERNKSTKFWVAYECCEIFSASSRVAGLRLSQSVSDYDDPTTDAMLWWLGKLAILIVGLVVGIIISDAITTSMLTRRGIDVKAVLKRPVVSVEESSDA